MRTSDFRGGRARLSVRTDLPVGNTGIIGARLTDATGSVFADEASYLVVEPPPPEAADDNPGARRVRVPEIDEIYPDWNDLTLATPAQRKPKNPSTITVCS